jgi:hydrogenase assembly chaperone HypC/HupF
MCLTIPYKIKSIKGQMAIVGCPGETNKKIGLSLVKQLKKGDYVLVQNNLAVRKVTKKEVQEIYKLFNTDKTPMAHR